MSLSIHDRKPIISTGTNMDMNSNERFPNSDENLNMGEDKIGILSSNGFLLLKSFITNDEVEEYLNRINIYIDQICPQLPEEEVFYEVKNNPSSLKQLQRMHLHDPWFNGLINGKVKQLAEILLKNEVITKNLQYFNKPPNLGKATPPHQDGFYFKLDPPEALTMWLALDDVDEENGCVRYVKGSHLKGIRDHSLTGTLGFSQGLTEYGTDDDIKNEIPVPAQKGDLIIHDSLTIHSASKNLSKTRNRRALGFIFYSAKSKENNLDIEDYKKQLEVQQKGQI